jgi:hypothetical protein
LEEATKKKGGAMLWLAIISFIAALVTFLPFKNIDDECMLGYKAICAFTPVSSLVLIALGVMFLVIRNHVKKAG